MQVLKSKKVNLFVTAIFLLLTSSLIAQSRIGVQAPPFKTTVFAFSKYKLDFLKVPDLELDKSPIHLLPIYQTFNFRQPAFNSPLADNILTTIAVLNNFNCPPMPFFCRIEHQMEQSARFPVKFRLGDVNYVDRLEQKIDWELGN